MSVTTYFILGTAAFWLGKLADLWSSQNFWAYGLSEGNTWAREEGSKNLSNRKALIFMSVVYAIFVPFYFVFDSGVYAMSAHALIGLSGIILAYFNWDKKKRKRKTQLQWLESGAWYGANVSIDSAGRMYYPLFPWIWVDSAEGQDAVFELQEKMETFRRHPIFPA